MNPLRVAAFQFRGSDSLSANAEAVRRGLGAARREGARILLTQEAALTGYAGVDRDSPRGIDLEELDALTGALRREADAAGVALALGTTAFVDGRAHNALQFFDAGFQGDVVYCKRAPYGEDATHYAPGRPGGVCILDGVKVGLRICFEFRFPEYFRELLLEGVEVALVAFSMVGPDDAKLPTARAHLVSRAAENAMPIVAANNLNGVQNAPTCIIDADGIVQAEAPREEEALICADLDLDPGPALRRHIRTWARDLIDGTHDDAS
jgi:NAD+ synthase (glutamine-hydrolysing)